MPIEIKQELYEVTFSSGIWGRGNPSFFVDTEKQAMTKAASLIADMSKLRDGWFGKKGVSDGYVCIARRTVENVDGVVIAAWYQVSGDCWIGPLLEPKFQDERVADGYKALADL